MQKRTVRTSLQRQSAVKYWLFSFFSLFASYPRLLLEVFIRRNFGERYFSLSTVVWLLILLGLVPVAASDGTSRFYLLLHDFQYGETPTFWQFIGEWGT